jgi:hypothetical protein
MSTRARRWLPILAGGLAIAGAILFDACRYDLTSVATHGSAQVAGGIRYGLHGAALVLLGLLAAHRVRLSVAYATVAFLVVLNVLATTRVVLGRQVAPHVAVAGVEIQQIDLASDTGRYAAFLCFRSFSRSAGTVVIDEQRLTPPFLPLPVDWSGVDALVIEMTCADGEGR